MKFERYSKRNAKRDFFLLPNEIFYLGLCSGELAVYAYLIYREDRETFQCWPSHNTIGKAVGLSKNTVRKYVGLLEDKCFIKSEYTSIITKKGIKRNGNLKYTICPIEEVKECYNQLLEKKRKNIKTTTEMNQWLEEYNRKNEYRVM